MSIQVIIYIQLQNFHGGRIHGKKIPFGYDKNTEYICCKLMYYLRASANKIIITSLITNMYRKFI